MEEYNFTDLILLIGTNPVPNYVTGKYYLQQNQNISHLWLVYSEKNEIQNGTEQIAENIKMMLTDKEHKNLIVHKVALSDISSSRKILKDIEDYIIKKVRDKNRIFHLNYTGGTKAMAVHVYRSLEKNLKDPCTFSYLDARNYQMKSDQEEFVSEDLRTSIGLSLNTLLNLHGMSEANDSNEKNTKPIYSSVISEFIDLIDQGKLNVYLDWSKEVLTSIYYGKNKGDDKFIETINNFLNHNEARENGDPLRSKFKKGTPQEVLKLLRAFPPEQSLLDGPDQMWVPDDKLINRNFCDRLKNSIEGFLHGKWLEHYVEHIVTSNMNQFKHPLSEISSINQNVRCLIHNKDFEIDILTIYGYQVCCISVTTARSEKLCKGKGFEVLHRSKQIGGDGAKSILITCLDNASKQNVSEELQTISGSNEGSIKVLGAEDLQEERLWKEISEYIRGSDL